MRTRDARVPGDDEETRTQATKALSQIANAAREQRQAVLLVAPTVEGYRRTSAGDGYVRIKFRVRPGQNQLIEGPLKVGIVGALKQLEPRS